MCLGLRLDYDQRQTWKDIHKGWGEKKNSQSNLKINKGKKQSQKESKCDNGTKVAMLMGMMQVMKYL